MSDSDWDNSGDDKARFPSELAAAIERARQRTCSQSMVESLKEKALALATDSATQVVSRPDRQRDHVKLLGLLVAASIALIVSLRWWLMGTTDVEKVVIGLERNPVYSAITTVSLTQAGYRQVEEDLNRADAQIEEASEALAIASVRQEIQKTLEEYYDWSK